MKKRAFAALALCLCLALAGCAAPHTQIPLQTPMPTPEPTPEATATPAPQQVLGSDSMAMQPVYSPYALPLSLRTGDSFNTALYKLVMDAAAAGETGVSLSGLNVSAEQVDSVRAFVLERGQSAYLSDVSLDGEALTLKYTLEDENAQATIAQSAQSFDAAAQAILEETCPSGYTLLQCAMSLYQYLSQHVEYSYEDMDDGLYGAIVNRRAVADGYAAAYAFLLDQLGIENVLAIAPDQSHVWNIVTIDGVSYHVDVTFGASLSKGQSLRYFGMNDQTAAEALCYTGWTASNGVQEMSAPVCSSTRFQNLANTTYSDADYNGNALFMDEYEGVKGIYRMDLVSGEVQSFLTEEIGGLAVLDGMIYFLRPADGFLYTYDLATAETNAILEGTKVDTIQRKGNTLCYAVEGETEMGEISP